ncbi:MAG: hypothetical protein PHY20_08210, partial [Bacteroidales bacterium]|nr:hypothetical protein [Bacteroidales bacterium]
RVDIFMMLLFWVLIMKQFEPKIYFSVHTEKVERTTSNKSRKTHNKSPHPHINKSIEMPRLRRFCLWLMFRSTILLRL